MSLSPQVEKLIEKAIVEGLFQKSLDFEDVCNRLMKRLPKYKSLRSGKIDPYSPAPRESPDAYIFLEGEHKWIYFEYTTTDRKHIGSYVRKLIQRDYYRKNAGRIQELVLVFSQPLRVEERRDFKSLVETQLQCSCQFFDSQDLVGIFKENAVDLVEPLLGIKCHPKWFRSLEDAVNELNGRYIAFPRLEEFLNGNLYIDENLAQMVAARICECKGPSLLTGRWGLGKTIFTLALGFRLQRENDFSVYYLDLGDHIGRDQRGVISEVFNKSLLPFHHSQVLFIIDNANMFPQTCYQFAQWAIREKANVLLVSRPVSTEMCDEKQYFPGLFETFIAKVPVLDSEEFSEESDLVNEGTSVSGQPPCFIIRPTLTTVRWMVNRRLCELGEGYEYTDNDLATLSESIGYNLTLLALRLNYWDPKSGPLSESPMEPIYNVLAKRFHLDSFPELYLLAALNYFDCPANLNIIFPNSERYSAFASTFLSEGGEARGLVLIRRKRVFGINSAEAELICNAGLHFKEKSLCDSTGRIPTSVAELLKILIVRYASQKPANPYEMMRFLRWAAFEAREFEGPQKEETVKEILSSVLTCPEFTDYLRDIILPDSLSMLGLGNIARLYNYLGLPRHHYSTVLSSEVLQKGIIRYENLWRDIYPDQEHWFTWREFFAWKHLNRLDKELAYLFLEQFEYDRLRSHGKNSLQGLSNLFLMAARTKWLKQKVQADLENLFGNPKDFAENFYRLREVNICFLIRHASLLGESSLSYLANYIPPKRMAQVAKGLPKLTDRLFYTLSRYMEFNYTQDFMSEFDTDEIYKLVYARNLAAINFPLSDDLYQRFLKNDLTRKVITSSFQEIQLFLRNLSLHGFRDHHRTLTAKKFQHEELKTAIITKMVQEKPPLSDIAFFLLNLGALNPQATEDYISRMLDIDISDIVMNSTLSTLALFLLSIWTAGSFSPLDFVSDDVIQRTINEKATLTSLFDLIPIGGIASLLRLKLSMSLTFNEQSAERIGYYLTRLQYFIPEDDIGRRLQIRALRIALNLEGVRFFSGSIPHSVISLYLDKASILEMLTTAKDQIIRDAKITLSGAMDRLPVAAERKVELFQSVLAWLVE